jgi:hypothetical protein
MRYCGDLLAPIIFLLSLGGCSQKHEPLFAKDYNDSAESMNSLVAFVGEKISWEYLRDRGYMDVGVAAN